MAYTSMNNGYTQMSNDYKPMGVNYTGMVAMDYPAGGYAHQNTGGDNPAAIAKGMKWTPKGKDKYMKSPWMNMG